MKRKYLFLDIDGVLNNKSTNFKTDHWPLDRYCAFLVGKIQLETDCQVILSSSWRHHPEGISTVEKHVVPILDKTGSCCTGIRGAEIYRWISDNVPWDERKEMRYAILDDEGDMLLWQKDNFFKTSFEHGLTDEVAAAVIAHLNAEGPCEPYSK